MASPFLFESSRFQSAPQLSDLDRSRRRDSRSFTEEQDYRRPSSSPPPIPRSVDDAAAAAGPPKPNHHPSMQLHLRVVYTGNLHLGLSTSLLINYPSPLFMSLPLRLSVTALAFDGTFVVAFEGDKRRVHFSVLDPKDEEDREPTSMGSNVGGSAAGGSNSAVPSFASWTREGIMSAGGRLLSSAMVDSEVGQGEKHVLKNVGKVEKFVLEVMRSTLESELVFP